MATITNVDNASPGHVVFGVVNDPTQHDSFTALSAPPHLSFSIAEPVEIPTKQDEKRLIVCSIRATCLVYASDDGSNYFTQCVGSSGSGTNTYSFDPNGTYELEFLEAGGVFLRKR